MKDDPRALLKLFRRTKVLTWAPILAVGWKYFDRVILNLRLFVKVPRIIRWDNSDNSTDYLSKLDTDSDTEFGRMLNQNMGVLHPPPGYVKSIGGDPRRLRVSCLRSD